MKLIDRIPVEGTDPVIYIGHRTFKTRQGGESVSRMWSAQYNHRGQTYYEPLKEKNKNAAIRAAHRIIERLERGEERAVVKNVTWTELQDRYIGFVTDRNRGAKTLTKYRFGLKSLLEFAESKQIAKPASFTPEHLWAFGTYLRTCAKNDEKTVYDRLMFVKQVFKWAHSKSKLLANNVLINESPDEPPPTEQPCFDAAQIEVLLNKSSQDDMPVFAIMAYMGMRFGEVRDLRWSDLHLAKGRFGQIYVKRGGSAKTTKGKANRVIPVHEALRKIIDTLPRAGERVFYEPESSQQTPVADAPLSERKLLGRIKRTCKACGFENPKKYKLHTFRHSFASMCAMKNTSYKYALEWMGHKSSDILDLYYTMYDSVADDAMAAISFSGARKPQL
jgi:integrase